MRILPSSLTQGRSCASDFSSCPPVSVCGTVPPCLALDSISRHHGCASFASTFSPLAHGSARAVDLPAALDASPLRPELPFSGLASPHASCPRNMGKHRTMDRFPIGYGFRPRLRGRLTQGRLPLPWKPRASGGRGSHPSFRYLCLHSLFRLLQRPSRARLHGSAECSPTSRAIRRESAASAPCLAPLHCLRADARPVSCYALFQGMAASEPTSWLSAHPHLISHSAWLWGLGRRSGLFPSRLRTLSLAVSLPRDRRRHSQFGRNR